MTAFHCLEAAGVGGMSIAGEPAVSFLENLDADLAILQSSAKASSLKLTLVPPREATLTGEGEKVISAGFPFGLAVFRGTVLKNSFNDHWALYDMKAAPGMSGAPVWTRNGVVGVLTFLVPVAAISGGARWEVLAPLVAAGLWES